MSEAAPAIIWFRNDLRLADHPALGEAVTSGRPILPLYIFEVEGRPLGGAALVARGQPRGAGGGAGRARRAAAAPPRQGGGRPAGPRARDRRRRGPLEPPGRGDGRRTRHRRRGCPAPGRHPQIGRCASSPPSGARSSRRATRRHRCRRPRASGPTRRRWRAMRLRIGDCAPQCPIGRRVSPSRGSPARPRRRTACATSSTMRWRATRASTTAPIARAVRCCRPICAGARSGRGRSGTR